MARTQIHYPQVSQDFIQATLTTSPTLTSGGSLIPFNSVSTSNGSSLSLSSSQVVIGSGVSVVRVSYSLMSDTGSTATYLFSRIRKNGTDVSQVIDAAPSVQFRATSETKLIGVAAGDTIGIYADSGGGSLVIPASRMSFILVEVVK